jgi:hypothetical protein
MVEVNNLVIVNNKWQLHKIARWEYTQLLVIIHNYHLITGSRDSAVSIATGHGLDDGEVTVRVPIESRIFSSPRHPDQFWGPPSLLSNGYWGLFLRG